MSPLCYASLSRNGSISFVPDLCLFYCIHSQSYYLFVQTKLVMSDWLAKKGDEVTRANKQKRQNWCLQCCFQNNHVSHRAIKCLVFVDWICCSWLLFVFSSSCWFFEEDKLTRRYFCKCRETFLFCQRWTGCVGLGHNGQKSLKSRKNRIKWNSLHGCYYLKFDILEP